MLIELEIENINTILKQAKGTEDEKQPLYFAVLEPLTAQDSVKNYIDVLLESI